MKLAHWLSFRKDKAVCWNRDSMLEAPVSMTAYEVMEKEQIQPGRGGSTTTVGH